MSSNIRGLVNFIGDIRNCKTEEEETERVDKELAKIRAAFSKSSLGGYAKRKYMWKIMYMYILGYSVDFGHMQCVDLIRSSKYAEKVVGYVGVSLLLIEYTEMLRLCIQTIKNDLDSKNEYDQCIALTCIANVGGIEFGEALMSDVQKLLVSPSSFAIVKKKAALCMLHLVRVYPDNLPTPEFAVQVMKLAERKDIGVVTSVISLLTGLAQFDPSSYVGVVPLAIKLLHQLLIHTQCPKEYMYYKTPDPWLQIKLLRILQFYPPPKDKSLIAKLNDILDRIVTKTEVTQSVNKNHADHAVLFEAMNVIIHLNLHGEEMLHDRAIHKLLHFINVKEGNIRYLGLDAMARLAKIPRTHKTIKRHLRTIHHSLADPDISIRKRALDLLYSICDEDNVVEILEHLLGYLAKAEYAMREEMVLKIAILTEKYATDLQWYINVVLQLLTIAGDFVSEDVWHRVVQIVTNNEDLQKYAAEMVYEQMKSPPVHESLVKTAGYILGEFGHLLDIDGKLQFEVLMTHFHSAKLSTKALLLTTFMKFANMYEDLTEEIIPTFETLKSAIDPEIQQRAVEYDIMAKYEDQDLISQIWDAMPDFSEKEESNLMRLVRAKKDAIFSSGVLPKSGGDDDDDGDDDDSGDESSDDSEAERRRRRKKRKEEKSRKAKKRGDEDDDVPDEVRQMEAAEKKRQAEREKQAQAAPEQDDLLGDLFGGGGASAAVGGGIMDDDIFGAVQSSAPTQLKADPTLSRKLMTGPSALLFNQDGLLQIGIKVQIEAASGLMRIILFFGNKSGSALENVTTSIENPSSEVTIDFIPADSFRVEPGNQFQQKCRALMVSPPGAVPILNVSFSNGGQSYVLKTNFPVIGSRFFTPHAFDQSQFKARWAKLGQELKQVIQVNPASGRLGVSDLKGILANGMGFGMIEGLDQNAANSVVCSIFHFSTQRNGTNVTVPVLARIEFNESRQAMRVTVRTPHAKATQAVIDSFSAIFT